jgi:hypothetical protein
MILTVELENAEDPEVAVCLDFEGLDLLKRPPYISRRSIC